MANSLHVPVARVIVGGLSGEDEIFEFIKAWRRFFLEISTPRHMPVGWSVDSPPSNEKMVDLRGEGGGTRRRTDEMGRDF